MRHLLEEGTGRARVPDRATQWWYPDVRLLMTTHSGPARAYGARFAVMRTLLEQLAGVPVLPSLPPTHLYPAQAVPRARTPLHGR